jgi:hypothetical protein
MKEYVDVQYIDSYVERGGGTSSTSSGALVAGAATLAAVGAILVQVLTQTPAGK